MNDNEFKKGDKVECIRDNLNNVSPGQMGVLLDNSSIPYIMFEDGSKHCLRMSEIRLAETQSPKDSIGFEDRAYLYHFHHPEVHKKVGSVTVIIGPHDVTGYRPVYTARCSSKDSFSRKIGRAIALGRSCSPKVHPEFTLSTAEISVTGYAVLQAMGGSLGAVIKMVTHKRGEDKELKAKLG